MDTLSDDLLDNIFMFLGTHIVLSELKLVCKRFNDIIKLKHITSCDLRFYVSFKEKLLNLIKLNCFNLGIKSLEISCQNLKILRVTRCYNIKLFDIDCPNLIELHCLRNSLSELDLKYPKLIRLDCSSNRLTSLDLSNCKDLEYLDCNTNRLTQLNTYPNLKELYCEYNRLTLLDVSNHINLKVLYCYCNKITSFNVSGCLNLKKLDCSFNNNVTEYDIVGMELDLSDCINLIILNCRDSNVSSLNISNCLKLKKLVQDDI